MQRVKIARILFVIGIILMIAGFLGTFIFANYINQAETARASISLTIQNMVYFTALFYSMVAGLYIALLSVSYLIVQSKKRLAAPVGLICGLVLLAFAIMVSFLKVYADPGGTFYVFSLDGFAMFGIPPLILTIASAYALLKRK